MISFTAGGQPAPWDGLLVKEKDQTFDLDLLNENKVLACLKPDGTLLIANEVGELKPSKDMAALGRAFYRAMIGKDPT